MDHLNQTADDLAFVKHVVERRQDTKKSPVALAGLWAGIVLTGCIWVDVSPQTCGIFWFSAPMLGFIASSFLGWKQVLRIGELDQRESAKQGLHWSSIFVAMIPIIAMAMTG